MRATELSEDYQNFFIKYLFTWMRIENRQRYVFLGQIDNTNTDRPGGGDNYNISVTRLRLDWWDQNNNGCMFRPHRLLGRVGTETKRNNLDFSFSRQDGCRSREEDIGQV